MVALTPMPWFALFLSSNLQNNSVVASGTPKNDGVPSFEQNGAREGLQINFGRILSESDWTGSIRAKKIGRFTRLYQVAYGVAW